MFENLRSLHIARPEQDAGGNGLCITTARCHDNLRASHAMFSRAICALASGKHFKYTLDFMHHVYYMFFDTKDVNAYFGRINSLRRRIAILRQAQN